MAKRTLTFEDVRRMALAIPGVVEGIKWGVPAFLLRGHMFACRPSHRSAEPNSLVVRIDFDRRDELLEEDPETYYVPDHYQNYPTMLVRLGRIHRDALRDLLRMSCSRVPAHRARKPMKNRKRAPCR